MPQNWRKKNGKRKTENEKLFHCTPFLTTAGAGQRLRARGGKGNYRVVWRCWRRAVGLARTDTRQCRYRLAEPFAHERTEACCVSRLKGKGLQHKIKIGENLTIVAYLRAHCKPFSNPNLNKWRNLTAVCSYHRSWLHFVQSSFQKRKRCAENCVMRPNRISYQPNRILPCIHTKRVCQRILDTLK